MESIGRDRKGERDKGPALDEDGALEGEQGWSGMPPGVGRSNASLKAS